MKMLSRLWISLICLLISGFSHGAYIDMLRVWEGEVKLWEMSSREVYMIIKAPGNKSITYTPSDTTLATYVGNFGPLTLQNIQQFGVWYWKGEKEPSAQRSQQWVELWKNDSESKPSAINTDEIEDMRVEKIYFPLPRNTAKYACELLGYLQEGKEYNALQAMPSDKRRLALFKQTTERINQATNQKGKLIRRTRPRDAAGRSYSGMLWKNEHCAILLEMARVRGAVDRISISFAESEETFDLNQKNAPKEVNGSELARRVEIVSSLIRLKGVPPLVLLEPDKAYNTRSVVLECLFRYYKLCDFGHGEQLESALWMSDPVLSAADKANTYNYNMADWLKDGYSSNCGFEELWNESTGKVNELKISKWRRIVMERLRAGIPIIYYGEKWGTRLIIGCDSKESKVIFAAPLMPGSPGEVTSDQLSEIVSRCMTMHAFVPNGGKSSRKERRVKSSGGGGMSTTPF